MEWEAHISTPLFVEGFDESFGRRHAGRVAVSARKSVEGCWRQLFVTIPPCSEIQVLVKHKGSELLGQKLVCCEDGVEVGMLEDAVFEIAGLERGNLLYAAHLKCLFRLSAAA